MSITVMVQHADHPLQYATLPLTRLVDAVHVFAVHALFYGFFYLHLCDGYDRLSRRGCLTHLIII
jgi:hypothetical protein